MPGLEAKPASTGERLHGTMLPLAAAVAALADPLCALAARN